MDTNLKNTFDSIIFDLDGTLWDSTANVATAWQKARQEVDYIKDDITQQTVRSITGMAYDAIFEKLYPYLEPGLRNQFKLLCAKYELEVLNTLGGELYPNLKATLQYLQNKYKLYIVSNCQCGYIETFLRLNNLENTFMAHQCYGTKNQPKFQNILDIVAEHGLSNPVYVGDTQGDYDSAARAGVPIIFATYGFGKTDGNPVAVINNFSELQELL